MSDAARPAERATFAPTPALFAALCITMVATLGGLACGRYGPPVREPSVSARESGPPIIEPAAADEAHDADRADDNRTEQQDR